MLCAPLTYDFSDILSRSTKVPGGRGLIFFYMCLGLFFWHEQPSSHTFLFLYYQYSLLPGPQCQFNPWIPRYETFNEIKKYPVACLNNVPRLHRIKLFDMICNKSYFNSLLYSFNHKFENNKYPRPIHIEIVVAHINNCTTSSSRFSGG